MKSVKCHLFKSFLIFILTLQLSFGTIIPGLYAQNLPADETQEFVPDTGDRSRRDLSPYSQKPWPLSILSEIESMAQTSEVQEKLKKFDQELNLIEEGRTQDLPQSSRDLFHTTDQRLEIVRRGEVIQTFRLDEVNVELPYVAYDTLRTYTQGHALVFEAINATEVVARHIVPNLNPRATVSDKELFFVMDMEGRIHATDMAFAKTEGLFRVSLPFFKNLWVPIQPITHTGELKLTFQTRGLEPFPEMDPTHPRHHEVVLPREFTKETNEIIFSAGDLVAYTQEGSDRKLIGVFSRQVTHTQILHGCLILSWLSFLVNPSDVSKKVLEHILRQIEKDELESDISRIQNTLTPLTRKALSALGPQTVEAFVDRSEKNDALSNRTLDRMTLETWAKSFNALRERATEIIQQDHAPDLANSLKEALQNQNLENFWQDLSNPKFVKEALTEKPSKAVSMVSKFIPSTRTLKILAGVTAGSALIAGSYHAEIAPVVNTVNWVWGNYIPDVVKDAGYRLPLFASIAYQMSAIPLVDFIGYSFVPAMHQLSKLIKNVPGYTAQKVSAWLDARVKIWGPLSTWQRNVTIGMRPYAKITLPFWHWFTKHILRQPNFLAALRAGLNPFSKDPTAGRIGLNSPLASQKTLHEKRAALSDLAARKKRANTLSRNLALLTVSEESGIDPATLLMIWSGKITPSEIERVLNDPEKRKEWEMITQAISKTLASLTPDEAKELLENGSPHMLSELYEEAQKIANQLRTQPSLTTTIQAARQESVEISQGLLREFSTFGIEEYELLSRGYATQDIGNQVRMEFKADHITMVLLPSFAGARANLGDPKNLAANPNGFLQTGPGQLYDIGYNMVAHYVFSGSRQMLVYYKKPEITENAYDPLPPQLANRSENIFTGLAQWTRGLLDFRKSDLGGVFQKSFVKTLKTIQASFVIAVILRLLLAGQSPEYALRGWWLEYTGSCLYIQWIWYVTQAGNYTDVPRVANKVAELQTHLIKIQQGIELQNDELKAEGAKEVLALYEEHSKLSKTEMDRLHTLDAENLIEYTTQNPPFATQRHAFVPWSAAWLAVGVSTYLAISLIVESLDDSKLTNQTLLTWTGIWLAFPHAMWLLTSKKSWDFLHEKFQGAKGWIKKRLGTCENQLE